MADLKTNRNLFLLQEKLLDLQVKSRNSSATDSWEFSPYSPLRVLGELISLVLFTIYIYLATAISYVFPAEPKTLSSEVILVTGGSSGIGKEVCLQLAELERNLTIVIWDKEESAMAEVLRQLKLAGVDRAFAYAVDVGDRKQVEAAAIAVKKRVGDVTMLFNLAESPRDQRLAWEMSAENVEEIFQTNILSYYWLLKQFLPFMVDRGYGHVIGMTSPSEFHGGRSMATHTASRCAVSGLFESLKEDVRHLPARPNIHFSLVHTKLAPWGGMGNRNSIFAVLRRFTNPNSAASKVIRGVRQNEENIYAPGLSRFEAFLLSILPPPVVRRIADLLDFYQL